MFHIAIRATRHEFCVVDQSQEEESLFFCFYIWGMNLNVYMSMFLAFKKKRHIIWEI